MDAELQEIRSFIFKDDSNYEIIEKLRKIQKARGHNLEWTYNAYKVLVT